MTVLYNTVHKLFVKSIDGETVSVSTLMLSFFYSSMATLTPLKIKADVIRGKIDSSTTILMLLV